MEFAQTRFRLGLIGKYLRASVRSLRSKMQSLFSQHRSLMINPTFVRFSCAAPFVILTLIMPVLFFSGCSKKRGSGDAAATGDYVTGTPLPERREGTSFFGGNIDRNQFQPIYFDFDSQSVRSSETGKIQQIASFMNSNSSEIIIAGFTDERGTAEYNRGLGERRAGAVRESLISQGVDGNRIQTVSFGLEMPADPGHDEAAWAKNRRAEIGVTK